MQIQTTDQPCWDFLFLSFFFFCKLFSRIFYRGQTAAKFFVSVAWRSSCLKISPRNSLETRGWRIWSVGWQTAWRYVYLSQTHNDGDFSSCLLTNTAENKGRVILQNISKATHSYHCRPQECRISNAFVPVSFSTLFIQEGKALPGMISLLRKQNM